METVDLIPLIEQLDDNIDDLEEALAPLLKEALSDTAGKLPLLDKAQLYVLITYAIESILFSFLRLNGISAKEHPVFRELIRVKQYFDKINTAETSDSKWGSTLDKPAAGRFIKHALAGNDRYDQTRAHQQAREKARAHIKFEELSNKRQREDDDSASASNPNSQLVGVVNTHSSSSPIIPRTAKVDLTDAALSASEGSEDKEPADAVSEQMRTTSSAEHLSVKEPKHERKRKKQAQAEKEQSKDSVEATSITESKRAKKRRKREENARISGNEELIISEKPVQASEPRSDSFQALLSGSTSAERPTTRERRKEAKRAAKKAVEPS